MTSVSIPEHRGVTFCGRAINQIYTKASVGKDLMIKVVKHQPNCDRTVQTRACEGARCEEPQTECAARLKCSVGCVEE